MRYLFRAVLLSLFVILMPLAAEAGLIRIGFDVDSSPVPTVGLGYIQFSDENIIFDDWVDVDDLVDLQMNLYAGWVDNYGSHIVSSGFGINSRGFYETVSGSLRIIEDLPDVFIVEFSDFGYSTAYNLSGTIYSLTLTADSQAGTFFIDGASNPVLGSFNTSVWFDDPVPVPLPSSLLMLIFAMLTMPVFKRKQH